MHEHQMSSYKSTSNIAEKGRKRKSILTIVPQTPTADGHQPGTPGKRVPILANFEEWMKMATDNKINAQNSWNFALIDYFHDMSLLREGDSVNFQKASCTLDGCVKIYTSRIDSVANETGKLLSGLAESKGKEASRGSAEENGESGDEDGEGEARPRKKAHRSSEATLVKSFSQLQVKKLELDFNVDPLLKKASADFDEGGAKGLLMNQLSIDSNGRVVFSSNEEVSSNKNEEALDPIEEVPQEDSASDAGDRMDDAEDEPEVDIGRLGAAFFPNLDLLDTLEICPTFKNFSLGETDTKLALPSLNPDTWKGGEAVRDVSGIFLDGESPMDFDDEDYNGLGLDLGGAEIAFGDGGEVWAQEAALETQVRPMEEVAPVGNIDDDEAGNYLGGAKTQFGIVHRHNPSEMDNNILNFFDEDLKQNWAGPEHWRIRRIKDAAKPSSPNAAAVQKRKEKEVFKIDFDSPMTQEMADILYTEATSLTTISLPKTQWRSQTRHLLPDDKHFNSKKLLQLFIKPKARVGLFRTGVTFSGPGAKMVSAPETNLTGSAAADSMDEEFWARKNHEAAVAHAAEQEKARHSEGAGLGPTYDAEFFQDDDGAGLGLPPGVDMDGGVDDDDDGFADAHDYAPAPGEIGVELLAGGSAGNNPPSLLLGAGDGTAGAEPAGGIAGRTSLGVGMDGFDAPPLVIQTRRFRPDYVQYARTAKRVDVRRLKEEMWKGLGFGEEPPAAVNGGGGKAAGPDAGGDDMMDVDGDGDGEAAAAAAAAEVDALADGLDGALRFTDVINGLQRVYPRQSMADISTSYCFICLLHLANEKGLVIENTPDFTELSIRRDWEAAAALQESAH